MDVDLQLDGLNYLIMSSRQNLCWLMEHVTIDREDAWRDKKFNEIRCQIDLWVAEKEEIIREMGQLNA